MLDDRVTSDRPFTIMTTVGEIMSADLIHVEPSELVTTAAQIMTAARAGSALVMEGERLLGIFTERDILTAVKREPATALNHPVADWMTPDPITVSPDVSVLDALRQMLRGGFRHLPVVLDEKVIGVVSLRDLAGSLARDLERG
jgi:CBS domain-containing protein